MKRKWMQKHRRELDKLNTLLKTAQLVSECSLSRMVVCLCQIESAVSQLSTSQASSGADNVMTVYHLNDFQTDYITFHMLPVFVKK